MKYTFSYNNPNSHYIDIEVEMSLNGESSVQLQLPAWRPGRYELGNFAKNIQQWDAYNEKGEELAFKKLSKDLWEVRTAKSKKLIVKYNYFAFELNAGSSFLSEDQLYVNPVNCCLYAIGREQEACEIKLKLPKSYEVATSMKAKGKYAFVTADFDELADSPFIASPTLEQLTYSIGGCKFYVWIQGLIKGDFDKLIKDFKAFSQEQGKLFKGFPFKEYHFLFQILPHKAYHGVEHADSTVIALGPSYEVMDPKKLYDELLGVSSHELFHAWNVKRIRPVEMWPYDFSKENYSRLGYLAEGATTWYGDLILYRSGVFNDESFFKTFSQLMDRHFNNPGTLNLSVAESSFDTWLDGYVSGVPNRKSSIYTEGALITFMLDAEIRKGSNGEFSFDDVLRYFYAENFKKGRGVSEADYKSAVEKFAGKSLTSFFNKYVNGAMDFTSSLKKALSYFGFELKKSGRDNYHESYLGFVCDEDGKVLMVHPASPAEAAGLSIEDQIRTVNGIDARGNISEWTRFFSDDLIELGMVDKLGQDCSVKMEAGELIYYAKYEVKKANKLNKQQLAAFNSLVNS